MTSKYVGDPQIRLWSPILLSYWAQGGEDPTWGTRPIDQVTIGLAIHELAAKVTDESARKSLKTVAATVVAKNSQAIAKESL